jgi:uncharacterized repeat protein (TIGR01451 family)
MKRNRFQWQNWLESHWVAPAYGGGLLIALSVFFFGAATNTMAGWLYVISGISFALLAIAAVLPQRSLLSLQVRRATINPVSVGDDLTLELTIINSSNQAKILIQVQDLLPPGLGKSATVIELLSPHQSYQWVTYIPTQKRGIYHWVGVKLRTATPLGLFWCSREREAPATAIVYPLVLPLSTCPLIDEIGQDYNPNVYEQRQFQMATEGVTRTLRPYRYGDPTRLIHWRSSARYGELRVRELETSNGGQEIIIGLDSAFFWKPDDFEQAVIAAASLYFYASHCQLNVQLWTAKTGLVYGNRVVLHTLADVNPGEDSLVKNLPDFPMIWLTQNPESLKTLPGASRWLLWPHSSPLSPRNQTNSQSQKLSHLGLEIRPDLPLQPQLQSSLRASNL